jgi:fermentation-respiration switch protein FrsA (DUF1100 family)
VFALLLYALLAWVASRTLYFPVRYPGGDWERKYVLGAEDVFLTASDGVRLHGWLVRSTGTRWMTLHLHGNGGNITHRILSARNILEAGSSVFLLDYRGYGRSAGRPTESGLFRDADAAYDYLVANGYAPERIIVHGESLGTAVASELASRRRCAGLILEAPFPSARAVAGRVLPLIGPLLIWGFDTKSRVSRLQIPLLVIHGDRDEVIAYELGRDVFAAAREPKWMWTIPGATHNDMHALAGAEFARRLRVFYDALAERVKHEP